MRSLLESTAAQWVWVFQQALAISFSDAGAAVFVLLVMSICGPIICFNLTYQEILKARALIVDMDRRMTVKM
jgi:hypothetical protein